MEDVEQPLTPKLRTSLLMLAIASSVTLVMAVVLVIILMLQSFTGITSTPPIVLNSCSTTYYYHKYSSPNNAVTVVFITAVLSIIFEIGVCVSVFPPLIMRIQPTRSRLAILYILVGLHTLSIILAFGKNLAYHIDLHSLDPACDIIYSEVLIKIALAFASADFFTSLLQTLFTLMSISRYNSDCQKMEKYQMVNTTYKTLLSDRAIEQRNKKIESRMERMPIEIPTPGRNSQAGPQNENYYKQARARLDRKERELAETNKLALNNSRFIEQRHPLNRSDTKQQKYQIFNSVNQIIRPPLPNNTDKSEIENLALKYPQLMQAGYSRDQSRREDGSQQNSPIQKKTTLSMLANQPGPIHAANRNQLHNNKVNQQTRGYLSFLRRMSQSNKQVSQNEGELIATIRGKYGKFND